MLPPGLPRHANPVGVVTDEQRIDHTPPDVGKYIAKSARPSLVTVIAICCTLFFPSWGWLYWIFAAAIAWSRIYLVAHWPSDVLATAFMAAGETLLILALIEFIWRSLGARFAPKLFARHPHVIERLAT